MKIIKEFKKAGEPTNAIPLGLCRKARDNLKIWRLYESAEEMREFLRADIEGLNRFEFVAYDENNEAIAMMVIAEYEQATHAGGKNILYTHYSFSTDKGALSAGYRWLLKLAKGLGFPLVMTTRQTGPMQITHTLKEVKHNDR